MIDTNPTPATTNDPDRLTNTDIVTRLVREVVNQGRYETIAEVVHERYRYHGPGGVEAEGPAGAEQVIAEFRAAFPDLHAEVTSEMDT